MKVCAEPGCPTLTTSTRCPEHAHTRDRARGTRQQRGYDAAYDAQRQCYASRMAQGEVFKCWRCERTVFPHAWHLGHCDDDRSVIHGPLHPPCNLGARGACEHPTHVSHE